MLPRRFLFFPLLLALAAGPMAACADDEPAPAGLQQETGVDGQTGSLGQSGAGGAGSAGVGGTAGAGSAGQGGGGEPVCTGARPAEGAWQAADSIEGQPPAGECPAGPTCAGAPWPLWRLHDFQPQSCGFQASYGLDTFPARTTVVVLLAGWCGFCQAQAAALQKMELELLDEGKKINFVVINAQNAVDNQKALTDRCTFPIFQDTAGVNAWGLHGGGKDDFYLYTSVGKLHAHLPPAGPTPTNLSTPEGYAALKAAILAVP